MELEKRLGCGRLREKGGSAKRGLQQQTTPAAVGTCGCATQPRHQRHGKSLWKLQVVRVKTVIMLTAVPQ